MYDKTTLDAVRRAIDSSKSVKYFAAPVVGGQAMNGDSTPVRSPADRRDVVGEVVFASNEHVGRAMERARAEFHNWESTPALERAARGDGTPSFEIVVRT